VNKPTVAIEHIVKTYGKRRVVDDVSFSVAPGQVFGLIGPNGAGKTTTIRIMMDIIRPDSGEVYILGQKLTEDAKSRIGYLPEERGLYRKLPAIQTLTYLASLKGVPPEVSTPRAEELLKRVDLYAHKDKKVEELSRGMGQLIQFFSTIIHDPDLLILDEPFSGLDPVNSEFLKEVIAEQRGKGKAIILSTHQMNQVEELCDRVLMINKGKRVLYGDLEEVRAEYRNNSVCVDFSGSLDGLKGVTEVKGNAKLTELFLDAGTTPNDILRQLVERRGEVSRFELSTPSLNEIFLKVAGRR
jgi:ABC-2 type transport system ATP-binding protein